MAEGRGCVLYGEMRENVRHNISFTRLFKVKTFKSKTNTIVKHIVARHDGKANSNKFRKNDLKDALISRAKCHMFSHTSWGVFGHAGVTGRYL